MDKVVVYNKAEYERIVQLILQFNKLNPAESAVRAALDNSIETIRNTDHWASGTYGYLVMREDEYTENGVVKIYVSFLMHANISLDVYDMVEA